MPRCAQTTRGGGILSEEKFADQDICDETKQGISDQGFAYMSLIQAKTLKPLLAGRDLLAQAKTGSGKTLAFLMPAIELLHKSHFAQRNGTGAVILAPTRELALQVCRQRGVAARAGEWRQDRAFAVLVVASDSCGSHSLAHACAQALSLSLSPPVRTHARTRRLTRWLARPSSTTSTRTGW